jgi:peptidyl-prolyl cis-trans isomerase SurA
MVLAALWLAPTGAEARVIDRIAAVVNDQVLTLRDVHLAAGPLLASVRELPNAKKRESEEALLVQRTLDELIGQTLILQEAQKLKLTASVREIDTFLDNLKRQYNWSDEDLTSAVQAQGTSMARYRDDIRRRILTNRVVQARLGSSVRVSDQDIDDAFEREYGGSQEEPEIMARHILLLVPEAADEATESKRRTEASAILDALRGGADFEQVAREKSEGPSATRGGALGTFRKGSLDPVFEKAAMQASVGEIVGPVRTRFGFHLIQVIRRTMVQSRDPAVAKKEIRGRLRQGALQKQLKRWVDELRRAAFIDVRG